MKKQIRLAQAYHHQGKGGSGNRRVISTRPRVPHDAPSRAVRILLCAGLSCFGASAFAQSSVTLYGLIDEGLTYVSRTGSGSAWRMEDSISQGDRFGIRGSEGLGPGLKAIFDLQAGFNPNTGASRQGGLEFGRGAIVGLASDTYGTLTLGRQFDEMTLSLIRYHTTAYTGIYGANPGDQDRIAGEWLNNVVSYTSPTIHGFQLGAQYSFDAQDAPNANYGRAISVGATYAWQGFGIGAAMTQIKDYVVSPYSAMGLTEFLGSTFSPGSTATTRVHDFRTAGVGMGYTIGHTTLSAVYTNTRYANPGVAETLQSANAGVHYEWRPDISFTAGYTWSKMADKHWNEFALIGDYMLSRRTDVYLSANYLMASGDANAALWTETAADGQRQLAARLGMRHKF